MAPWHSRILERGGRRRRGPAGRLAGTLLVAAGLAPGLAAKGRPPAGASFAEILRAVVAAPRSRSQPVRALAEGPGDPTGEAAPPPPLRFFSAADRPREVLMVLTRETQDEVRAMLGILREIDAASPGPEGPITLRVIPEGQRVLEEFDLVQPGLEGYLAVEQGFRTEDLWMRDWGLLGYTRGADHQPGRITVLNTGRGRELRNFPGHLSRRLEADYLAIEDRESAGDYGGNVLTSPDDWLMIGSTSSYPLRQLLRTRGYRGRTVVLETDWLEVGHVDELLAFLPDPREPRGYVVAWADPELGLQLLAGIPAAQWGESLRATVAAGLRAFPDDPRVLEEDREVLEKTFEALESLHGVLARSHPARRGQVPSAVRDLIAVNREAAAIQARNVERLRTSLLHQGGPPLRELRFPALFTRAGVGQLASLVPNPVNLLVLGDHLVVPDPLVPEFRSAILEALAGSPAQVHFLPGVTYLEAGGGLHCATQVLRQAPR